MVNDFYSTFQLYETKRAQKKKKDEFFGSNFEQENAEGN